ncbi:hypothetical protein EV663_101264 [Rhodovulum bhavnagarense]|uniref:Uncharacterized protein n=1 Tax=Rhodovulum bhavnagarense TaxID=992286 RepID=A0A4R2RSY7_9RHOB|nr:hypothetical protein [Rhodovulum bhavnagarense]TCP63001.1 hypothetical protein EV663_101264 [Rhodovulum bhavnagarense]
MLRFTAERFVGMIVTMLLLTFMIVFMNFVSDILRACLAPRIKLGADAMKARGFILYLGKLTVVDSFRIGCIGQLDVHVMRRVVAAAGEVLAEMGVNRAAPPAAALEEHKKLAS